MQRGNDCAVRERELAFAKGLYRNVIAQLGAQLLEFVSCQLLDRDQAPVAVTCGNFDTVDRRGVSVGLSGCGGDVKNDTGHRTSRSGQASDALHRASKSLKGSGQWLERNAVEKRPRVFPSRIMPATIFQMCRPACQVANDN